MTEEQNQIGQQENPNDKLSTGLQVLSFCIPLAGAIIYFSNKSDSPNKAKAACHAALWGVGIGIVINILVTLMTAGMK
jgi:FtsH-binding integral membrane protein